MKRNDKRIFCLGAALGVGLSILGAPGISGTAGVFGLCGASGTIRELGLCGVSDGISQEPSGASDRAAWTAFTAPVIEAYAATQVIHVGPSSLKAGTVVDGSDIRKNGILAYFTSSPISDAVFARMYGKSYKEDCTVPREDLRYLKVLYCGPDGQTYVGELVCHKDISQDLLEIFRELYDNFYMIEKMVLVDDYDADDLKSAAANNTSCFNYRQSSGESGTLSYHALGKAIDINPLYNPYVWTDQAGEVHYEPEEGKAYADREKIFSYKIEEEDLCVALFKEHGFTWGGSWGNGEKDYMHFSIR